MIDPHVVIKEFLDIQLDLTDVTIYAGRNVPPPGYKPSDGDAIVFKVRGGGPDYDDALLIPSYQFKCYSTSEQAAYALYLLLYDALHNGNSADILHAESETLGQSLEESGTEWLFVLAHFKAMLRQTD